MAETRWVRQKDTGRAELTLHMGSGMKEVDNIRTDIAQKLHWRHWLLIDSAIYGF